ncbi:MAG: alpha/beta hydrolase [Chroococcidiopsidaceae cyanobacterium CP_BM_ER_R8_30]|nr:alpha/beta hydrolase [Chroococcidiopsidaceae cyanobacterium CP_BM_ER_R8_30]
MVESTLESSQAVEQEIESAIQQLQELEQLEKKLKDIYLISGLGADERVFQLLKFKGYQPVHIRWLEPERGEPIEQYAKRLTAQISSSRPIIVGLSFGGIIAVEIAKQLEVEKVIVISSAKNRGEIPPYFKMLRWFPIQRVFPFKSLLWMSYWLAYWFFSLETIAERQLLKAILLDTNARFIKWATHKVVTWKNETIPENLHHIHGLSDRIFSIRFVKPHFTVEKGGHFMIMNRAEQISTLLEQIIG